MAIPDESKDKICQILDEEHQAKLWSLKSETNEKIIKICRQALSIDESLRRCLFEAVFVQGKCSNTILNEPEILLLRHIIFNGGVITLNTFKIVTGLDPKKVRDGIKGLIEENMVLLVTLHRNVKILVLDKNGAYKYIERNKF